MSDYWYCTKHHRVETGDDACAVKDLLGPYPSQEEASRALERVKENNDRWDAEDEDERDD